MALFAGPLFALALHLLAATRYGFFRDELYFIACGRRLAWGYVDQPPLVAALARVAFAASGGSVAIFRLPAFLLHASVCLLAAVFARRLGGGQFSSALAGLSVAASPLLLATGHLVSMNAIEPLLWLACAMVIAALLDGGDERLWLVAGALCGVGLLNKHSMAFFAFALIAGLAISAPRLLHSRWLAAGLGLAVLIFLPHFIWQLRAGFPMLELLRNGQLGKNLPFELKGFLAGQVVEMGPAQAVVWIAGLVWLLRGPRRALGVAYLALLALFIALHAKVYYCAPVYPMLISAGAVAIERMALRPWRWVLPVAVGTLGLVLAPLAIPMLPEESFIRYQNALGLHSARLENKRYGELPQVFADEHGWPELVAAVRAALPPGEHTAIYTQNYGEAAALEILGPDLPPVESGHNQYYLWGPHPADTLIIVGGRAEDHRKVFADVRLVSSLPHNRWVMPYEDELPIWICRAPKSPIAEIWPHTKHYD